MKLIFIILALLPITAFSAETYQRGKVNNITSLAQGLLIMLDTGKPTGCVSSSPWMLIPEENKTMISVALAMYAQGKTGATVYIDKLAPGYCKVIQYDPH